MEGGREGSGFLTGDEVRKKIEIFFLDGDGRGGGLGDGGQSRGGWFWELYEYFNLRVKLEESFEKYFPYLLKGSHFP